MTGFLLQISVGEGPKPVVVALVDPTHNQKHQLQRGDLTGVLLRLMGAKCAGYMVCH
jgi:hypothetical protein